MRAGGLARRARASHHPHPGGICMQVALRGCDSPHTYRPPGLWRAPAPLSALMVCQHACARAARAMGIPQGCACAVACAVAGSCRAFFLARRRVLRHIWPAIVLLEGPRFGRLSPRFCDHKSPSYSKIAKLYTAAGGYLLYKMVCLPLSLPPAGRSIQT
jgi:hypothetical protein